MQSVVNVRDRQDAGWQRELVGAVTAPVAGTIESLVMRGKTGTIRRIEATHRWPKLMRYSAIRFDG